MLRFDIGSIESTPSDDSFKWLPNKLWMYGNPSEEVYALARERDFDAVVMVRGNTWSNNAVIHLYLIDIERGQVYHQKGRTRKGDEQRMAKAVFADFIEGRGG